MTTNKRCSVKISLSILTVILNGCHDVAPSKVSPSVKETALTKSNKDIIKNSKYSVVVSCEAQKSMGDLGYAGANTYLTSKGEFSLTAAHWGWQRLPDMDKSDKFVIGKTKFISVVAMANWNSKQNRIEEFYEGDGGFFVSMEAFPYSRSASKRVSLAAFALDGKELPREDRISRPINKQKPNRRYWNTPQSSSVRIFWKSVQDYQLEKNGMNMVMVVENENKPRTYFIKPEVIANVVATFRSLIRSTNADSAEYMSKCRAVEQIPVS